MKRRQLSLAQRLGWLAAAGTALLALTGGLVLGRAFESALLRGLDLQLLGWLDTLAADLEAAPDEARNRQLLLPRGLSGTGFERVFSGDYWQVQSPHQVLVSPSLWDARLPLDSAQPVSAEPHYADVTGPRGQQLRLAQLTILLDDLAQPVQLAVAVNLATLQAESRQFRWFLWLALAGLGAGGLALAWLQLRLGLRPLRQLTRQLGAMAAGRRQRLQLDLGPDLAPVAERLHAVLEQQARIVQRARAQAQDLAHALKTPLSVLRADLPQLPLHLQPDTRRQLDLIGRHLERYLGEAQVQSQATTAGTPLAPVVAELCAMFARVHATRDLQFVVDIPAVLTFAGEITDLQEMLGNLLDNACRFARQQVRIGAATEEGVDGMLVVQVVDDGPGLTADQIVQALRRGERLDTREPGSGLGLDIVQRIAASYGGSLELDAVKSGGLQARLTLPGGAADD